MEATIVINGRRLTEAQSATVRVALNSWLDELHAGRAQDLGKIGPLYLERGREVLAIIHGEP